MRGEPGARLDLVVDCFDGQKHLPIVKLKPAA